MKGEIIMKRLQGNKWYAKKNTLVLISVTESNNGNIRGIYTDGQNQYYHWMNDNEKKKYLNSQILKRVKYGTTEPTITKAVQKVENFHERQDCFYSDSV